MFIHTNLKHSTGQEIEPDTAKMEPSNFWGDKTIKLKIRGQRIELAEIDTALKSHPAISQAVSIK